MSSTTPGSVTDPFADRSVHGLWPLVADEEAPGGLRFADLRIDAPEDCLVSPDQLPDAEVSIHTFHGSDDRALWMAAARKFGGNGVALTSLVVGLASAGLSLWMLGSEP